MGSLHSTDKPAAPKEQAQAEADAQAWRRAMREQAMRPVQGRGPHCFQQLRMSDQLLEWILADPDIQALLRADEQALESAGERYELKFALDYPEIESHRYYEGYGHAASTPDPILSMNPRYGSDMLKQRGPLRLVSFIRSFKALNSAWIREAFSGERTCFNDLLEQDLHLSDLSLQFHWGGAVGPDSLGWHVDGPNSAFHMGISLMSTRILHTNSQEQGHQTHSETAGDVYVGTPFSVVHAVEYPPRDFRDRIFAVQVRFLFPSEGFKYERPLYPELMERICHVVNSADIVMPSLDDVRALQL